MVDTGNAKAAAGPVEAHDKPPPKLDDVLPVSLKIAGWTIPLVIGLIGLVKTVSDMNIAAQREVRDRAAAEISFFDKQYDYATRSFQENRGDAILTASLEAMLERPQPDLRTGPLFDWALDGNRASALRQICAARRTALGIYNRGVYPAVDARYRERWRGVVTAAASDKTSAAAAMVHYDDLCRAQAPGAVVEGESPADAAKAAAAAPPPAVTGKPAPVIIAKTAPPVPVPVAPTPPPPVVAGLDCDRLVPRANVNTSATAAEAAGVSSGWRIDMFWCARPSAVEEAAQFAQACNAYKALTAQKTVGDGKPLGRVRLRRLPASLQGKGYPTSGSFVRYDSGDLEEQLLAQAIASQMPGASVQPAHSGTRWYLSTFSCGG